MSPNRSYLQMTKDEDLKLSLPVTIKQKLVYDGFQLEPRSGLAGEVSPDWKLEDELLQVNGNPFGDLRYVEWFKDERVRAAVEDISNQMSLKIKIGRDLHVSILIPRNVFSGKVAEPCPVHVRFIGGGFCTGSTDHALWVPYHVRNLPLDANAITFLPSHCKLPEADGAEIMGDIEVFWDWFESNKFQSDVNGICPDAKMDKTSLLVSGDSAGGFLAGWSWLSRPNLRIKALYMQYPMLRAYARKEEKDKRLSYRGKAVEKKVVDKFAESIVEGRNEQDTKRVTWKPPRINSIPPLGMDCAFALSTRFMIVPVNGKIEKKEAAISCWKYLFRHPDIFDVLKSFFPDPAQKPKNEAQGEGKSVGHQVITPKNTPPDGIKIEHTLSLPSYCPPTFISHGATDDNVPLSDSRYYKLLVESLFSNMQIKLHEEPGKAHAFDYTLNEWGKDREWLYDMKNDIVSSWLAGNPDRIQQIHNRQAKHPIYRDGSGGTRTAFDIFPDDDAGHQTHSCRYDQIKSFVGVSKSAIEDQYKDAGSSFLDKFSAFVDEKWSEHVKSITSSG